MAWRHFSPVSPPNRFELPSCILTRTGHGPRPILRRISPSIRGSEVCHEPVAGRALPAEGRGVHTLEKGAGRVPFFSDLEPPKWDGGVLFWCGPSKACLCSFRIWTQKIGRGWPFLVSTFKANQEGVPALQQVLNPNLPWTNKGSLKKEVPKMVVYGHENSDYIKAS